MTAHDIRAAARRKLGTDNGWSVATFGCVIAFICSYAVNAACQHFCGLEELSLLLAKVQVGEASPEALMAAFSKRLGALFVAMSLAYYVSAVFKYGLSALAIAVVRGGARLGHAFAGFSHGWSTLGMMVLMHLYVFLWTCCLVVPGVCALFSYALSYLVKADHPDWSADRCITESKRLMAGHRWAYFRLCLSFLGWFLLGFVTFGLAFVIVLPYFRTAEAAFYEDLLDHDPAGESAA